MFPEIQANQLTSARTTEAEEEIHQHHNDIGKTQGNPGQDQNSLKFGPPNVSIHLYLHRRRCPPLQSFRPRSVFVRTNSRQLYPKRQMVHGLRPQRKMMKHGPSQGLAA